MSSRDPYYEWKERVFGSDYMIWHDGLQTGAVTGLVGPAREEALAMLRIGVAKGDSHAALALAEMGDVLSLDAMRAQIATSHGSEKVRAVLSVHRLAPDESLATHLIDVMRSGAPWSVRIDAAIGLRHFGSAVTERALLDAVATDTEYLVRYHAGESLLARSRVGNKEISKHPEIFARIIGPREGPPAGEDFTRYEEARRMLEALVSNRRV